MKKIEPKVDKYMEGDSVSMKPTKSPPRYPTMRLDLEVIPEAKKWEVSKAGTTEGPEYTITLKVKMIGISQSRFENSVEFELREIEVEPVKKKPKE